ncbi:type II toxin-antitoxin system RelB/DinJ family antitoxin [Methylobacterium sp. J-026]|uniref:type II toxin-antitoxin system RelB/DinJ family antitoxin n=1 Tax=Methylobacterium sp. J-026 TaxID=2836624 RepID=UPI001FBBD4CA|nr:type II toxin-antitoxin system RelB/DinJ family antitoxin [Methylobacterium sp. J-026]MCJ2138043.1 type II toxin-antitoxin system RelB/DinJ family antitoxin [Methylobacterium sp. J-026]
MAARTHEKVRPATKTKSVRAQVDPGVKPEAAAVLGAVGLSLSDAFRLMLQRVVAEGRLPFDPPPAKPHTEPDRPKLHWVRIGSHSELAP